LPDDILMEAAALIMDGKMAEAQKLLEPFIQKNPQDIRAWLLIVETFHTIATKRKALETCLRLNPDTLEVQQALSKLESASAPSPGSEAPQQVPAQRRIQAPPAPRPKGSRLESFLAGLLILAICLLAASYFISTSCIDFPGIRPCTRVLFIGNSYTYVNDLPGNFAKLARAGGHQVEVGMAAPGGWSLSQHASSAETLDKLNSSKWDFVVLQEQSQIPSVPQFRETEMYPAARQLVSQIEAAGATPVFFLTWAHQAGWPENGMPDYRSMQSLITQGYFGIAQELGVRVAPVGYAWSLETGQNTLLPLWQEDGSHPTPRGTYLAACVFYATVFSESPAGLSFKSDLSKEDASHLQAIAAEAVLKNQKLWNIP
jgi:hypothetical protein